MSRSPAWVPNAGNTSIRQVSMAASASPSAGSSASVSTAPRLVSYSPDSVSEQPTRASRTAIEVKRDIRSSMENAGGRCKRRATLRSCARERPRLLSRPEGGRCDRDIDVAVGSRDLHQPRYKLVELAVTHDHFDALAV